MIKIVKIIIFLLIVMNHTNLVIAENIFFEEGKIKFNEKKLKISPKGVES